MKFPATLALLVLSAFTALAAAQDNTDHTNAKGFDAVQKAQRPLRILVSNDDSWASGNIRALYYALKRAGHTVLMVAPVVNQSGKGGTVVLPGTATLTTPGRGNSVPAGAPYHGAEPFDAGITYVNATPGGSVLYGLDLVAPTYAPFDGKAPQLIASGINEGPNLGPFLYTLSGTIGATYVGVERGIPGIAFSADSTTRNFDQVNWDDARDESVFLATNAANLISGLTYISKNDPIIPLGLGANVNFGSGVKDAQKCKAVKWKQTRLTGGAYIDKIVIDSKSNLPTYQNIVGSGENVCYSGDCRLQGEQDYFNQEPCAGAISIFSVDYDAPTKAYLSFAFQSTLQKLNDGANALKQGFQSIFQRDY